MPVSVPIVVADPPAAPTGYMLVAFEVRAVGATECGVAYRIHAGTPAGLRAAVGPLVTGLVGSGWRLAAIAWWADRPLEECVNGRERLVSVYDPAGRWLAWEPEDRVGSAKVTPMMFRLSPGQKLGQDRTHKADVN